MSLYRKHKFAVCIVFVFFLFACGDLNNSNSKGGKTIPESTAESQYVEGEILVKFKGDEQTALRASSFHRAIGARVKQRFEHIGGIEHVELPSGLSVKDAIKLYMENPSVEYVEPNYIVKKTTIPNDSFFDKQWGLHNTGQTIPIVNSAGTPDADIDAPEAWDIHTGGLANVIVATLDTGVDYNHPDLKGNVFLNQAEVSNSNCTDGIDNDGNGKIDDCSECGDGIDNDGNGKIDDCRGWNFVSNTPDPMDDDVYDCDKGNFSPLGHGTHVAGIIGAIGNNTSGVSGVNWNVKILPVKFLDRCGNGTIASAAAGMNYIAGLKQKGHNIKAVNGSYGGYYGGSPTEQSAINNLGINGMLFIAAGGNDNYNNDVSKFYPASYNLPNMIAVAASDFDDKKAWFSNYGIDSVHLAAPGEDILSTLRFNGADYPFGYMSGTSMATPMVTGLSALIASYNPSLTHMQIREVILSTVDKKPSFNSITATGGRLNAHRALLLANTPEAIIMAPSNVTAAVNGPAIDVSWTDNSINEAGFDIERKLGYCGTYSSVGNVTSNQTLFADTNIEEGAIYYYRVFAVNSTYAGETNEGRSSPSKYATSMTTLPAPSGLIANSTADSIELYWTDNSSYETGFRILRKTSSEASWSIIANVSQNAEKYSDKSFLPGVTYNYKITAYRTICGTPVFSSYSNTATANAPGGSTSGGGGGGGCFIATAAYGSFLSPEVQILRQFRDRHLLTNPIGRAFVRLYYTVSPPLADFIQRHKSLRTVTRFALTPIVYGIKYPNASLSFIGLFAIVALIAGRRKSYN